MQIIIEFMTLFTLANCIEFSPTPTTVPVVLFPAHEARDVNIDTHLVLSFPSSPAIGSSGNITVHDVETGRIVDRLDLSIPFSPSPAGNGSTKANYSDTNTYQTNIVGGLDFYYNPIIVRDKVATIYLHNNRLEYNRTYAVVIDPGVFMSSHGDKNDTTWPSPWSFATKVLGPMLGSTEVRVAADGSADFTTIQGALDWAPSNPGTHTTIYIKDGEYEELVFFQYKSNIILRGQSRNKTIVGYSNNSAFNPPNRQGPSRRPAFSFRGVADLQLSGFTIVNRYRGQAEALLIDGVRVIVDHMNLNGSGDALTTYGTAYITDTELWGDGDTILGYGSVFWNHSTIITTSGPVSWTRTAQGIHGNVMLDCTIISERGASTFARLPDNTGGVAPNWPFAEMVLLNTKTAKISSVGWGPIQGPPFDASNVRFWEFNTTDLVGNLVDYAQRMKISRQLLSPSDDSLIEEYSDPSFVLGGWTPTVR